MGFKNRPGPKVHQPCPPTHPTTLPNNPQHNPSEKSCQKTQACVLYGAIREDRTFPELKFPRGVTAKFPLTTEINVFPHPLDESRNLKPQQQSFVGLRGCLKVHKVLTPVHLLHILRGINSFISFRGGKSSNEWFLSQLGGNREESPYKAYVLLLGKKSNGKCLQKKI